MWKKVSSTRRDVAKYLDNTVGRKIRADISLESGIIVAEEERSRPLRRSLEKTKKLKVK